MSDTMSDIERTFRPMTKEWVCYERGCDKKATTQMNSTYHNLGNLQTISYLCDEHVSQYREKESVRP